MTCGHVSGVSSLRENRRVGPEPLWALAHHLAVATSHMVGQYSKRACPTQPFQDVPNRGFLDTPRPSRQPLIVAHGRSSQNPSPVPLNLSSMTEDWYTDFADGHGFKGERRSLLPANTAPAGVASVKIRGICVPDPAYAIVMELRCARVSAGNTRETLSAWARSVVFCIRF